MLPALLIQILIFLCVLGVLLWAINALPLDPTIKQIARVVIIVFAVLCLLGLLAAIPTGGGFWPFYPVRR